MAQTHQESPLHCEIYDLGLAPFADVWTLQKALVQRHREQPQPDRLLLVEHPGVYTLGQGSTLAHLKLPEAELSYPLFRTERGGEVTHHCPGQLVGYPILDLKRHQSDLHWYLRQLEAVLILALAKFGVEAGRQLGLTGVWVGDYKLAAIGIKVSRWVTMHGFALNVCPDLGGFEAIAPCGITDKPVGTLAQFCPGVTVAAVRPVVVDSFAQVFGVSPVIHPYTHLSSQPVIQNVFPPGL
ncbi:MAG: lipoyl(octanoyl) transferase [Shackletoniella antarctica]|jgi:lipoyl(octanoyl) transferase|uniref:Octanoyltransferase n=1 Tax=Shackletoniella antarctica TaxID=268115 RepID=A0A2W4YKS5_9CYAN|nr:MAG: lipoyl(octanoyl) transferase [Shackletoniella antarctica]